MMYNVRPQRWQPTRLPHPWDSPGKNTGVGCHFLLQCTKVKVKSLSRVRLLATPWTAAHQAPPSITSDDGVPLWVEPEKVLRLAELPSARTVPVEVVPETSDDPGPRRVRGEMVWLHKTAPVLVIEGRRLSPEDHAAGRR